jgi:hypothetical protein
MRTNQDAAKDQDDHLGNAQPGKRGTDNERQRRYQRHDQQRFEALGVHRSDRPDPVLWR